MADSLFDNRYRYDYIYPRGRSGETLRAVDTQQNNRPVVIKRPAPGDAPPIRAGQEVSILNERRALTKLAGHPALTDLLGDGQFAVGGGTHQYIVMERAHGIVIGDAVTELGARGERLPELEILVIVDRLLDLLATAHNREIVYNDVDAKHLFWDRDSYRLKVIDWGNAVFLEGDEVTPQGISRLSDVYQTGELLYFTLTAGGRPDIPRDADAGFLLDFGDYSDEIAPTLQQIISKAMHPNPKLRYSYITELRRDLADYRAGLERERDAIIGRVNERLRRNLSKNELQTLLTTLEPARAMDPGYPAARNATAEIEERLRDLEVSAGLDAVRIYMESNNWSRAVEILGELRDRSGSQTGSMVNLLLDCALLLLDSPLSERRETTPPAITDAISGMFDGHYTEAARTLLLRDTDDDDARRLQWLLAERISSHIPEALLLRPNLYRLELSLATLAREGYDLREGRSLLNDIRGMLDGITTASSIADLRDSYREIVDLLSTLNTLLSTASAQYSLPNRKLPLSSLDRSLNAAMALADNMHIVGKQATSSPRDALSALDISQGIDPTSPVWDNIARMLDDLYRLLQSYQTYVPSADGSDLAEWLATTQATLVPFAQRLFDEMLTDMVTGLQTASRSWDAYTAATLRGDRATAIDSLGTAADAVNTLSPTLAGWLGQLRSVVDGAAYIERHAIYGGLGRALADGWQAFDRSRLGDAERLGQQAFEIARNEDEKFAAQRLRDLSRMVRDWVERNAAVDPKRTQRAMEDLGKLFTPEETQQRASFDQQMPSKETYLRAMVKGLVETYHRHSSAATRLLAFDYVLLGTMDAHDGLLNDATFWRDAAIRALGSDRAQHLMIRTLEEHTERRRDIGRVQALINQLNGPDQFGSVEKVRRLVEDNPQAKSVAPAVHSLREFELGLRDWVDGEFRTAGLKLENALKSIDEAQAAANINVPEYRAWVDRLNAGAAQLHVQMRALRQGVEKRPADPDKTIRDAHHAIARVSAELIGTEAAATLIQWRDEYERFLAAYTDDTVRRSQKLERFSELFRAMFIDRHPAYPLYRHWYDLVDQAPEFPAPPTDDPTPRLDESEDDGAYEAYAESSEDQVQDDDYRPMTPPMQTRRPTRVLAFVALLAIIGTIAAVIIFGGREGTDGINIALTISATPTDEPTATDAPPTDIPVGVDDESPDGTAVGAAGDFVTPTPRETESPTDAATIEPTATFTDAPPTETPTDPPPTATFTPTITPTPSDTPTITPSPTVTLPPAGLQGRYNLIDRLDELNPDEITWTPEQFSLGPEGAYWRYGVGGQTPGDEIALTLSADTLERFFGNNAATRVRRVDAGTTFLTADPSLQASEIYFGLALREADGDREVALIVRVVDLGTLTEIDIYQRVDGEETLLRQIPVQSITPRLRLDRDLTSGAITLFVNDIQVGDAIPFVSADAALLPAVIVKDGGVVIGVRDWRVTLR